MTLVRTGHQWYKRYQHPGRAVVHTNLPLDIFGFAQHVQRNTFFKYIA